VAPVAQRAEVAQVQAVLQPQRDAGDGAGDLAGDEGFTSQRALVVEEDAVAGVHAVGLTVVDRDPVGVHLGHCVGAARVKGRGLPLRNFLHQAVELGRGSLIEAGLLGQAQDADGFQDAQRADAVGVGSIFRLVEAHSNVAHRAEVVDLVRLGFLNDADQVGRIGQVAVVQLEALVVDVRVLVQVIHAIRVEQAAAALDAVHLVPFGQQELSEIGTILASDAGDKGNFS
jgi:hypothetical protein